jgi:hypothetical protein
MSPHTHSICAPASLIAQVHGSHCSCRMLAAAAGADPSAIGYALCRGILQKRWRMTCDHIPEVPRIKVTPEPPPHDPHDPLQALLIANADLPSG